MNVTGIVCELNPPHNGHKRLFDFARRASEDSAIVAVMSGNFVQRGEHAIFSKHSRTEAALNAGVDLVLELPLPYALSSAEGFAKASVGILNSTGIIDTIAFGAECGDIDLLNRAATALDLPECTIRIRDWIQRGNSYARAYQLALNDTLGSGASILESPNNMLAIQYLRAISSSESKMSAICLKREPGITASGIRNEIRDGKQPENLLPSASYSGLLNPNYVDIAMLSRIRLLKEAVFFNTPGSSDGIAERALRFCKNAGSIEELLFEIKTKRHTLSRIRRYIMCLVLGITNGFPDTPPYIRILGANDTGRALLGRMETDLPVITKPADGGKHGGEILQLLELEASSTDFYNLGYENPDMRRGGAEWRISPVMI